MSDTALSHGEAPRVDGAVAALRARLHVETGQAVLAGTAAVGLFSPIYLLNGDVHEIASSLVSTKAHAVGLIPDGVPVSASNQFGAHLSERRRIYTFPFAVHSRWIIVDSNDPTFSDTAALKQRLRTYETDKEWRIVFSSHGVTVLHKRPTHGSGAHG